MKKRAMHAQRGQALAEFAISASLIISVFFFALAMTRYSVLNERSQSVLRYVTLIAENQDPYGKVSAASAYETLMNEISSSTDGSLTCTPPSQASLGGAGQFVNAGSSSFWLPQGSVKATCKATLQTFPNASVGGTDLNVISDMYTISGDASGFSKWLTTNNNSKRPVAGTITNYRSVSIATLIECYSSIGSIVADSIFPPAVGTQLVATAPLLDSNVPAVDVRPRVCAPIKRYSNPLIASTPIYPPALPPASSTGSSNSGNSGSSGSKSTGGSSTGGKTTGTTTPPITGGGSGSTKGGTTTTGTPGSGSTTGKTTTTGGSTNTGGGSSTTPGSNQSTSTTETVGGTSGFNL